MSERLPKLDSHIIDHFLHMAENMEEHLDDETYASVKRIFSKDVFMYENFQTLPENENENPFTEKPIKKIHQNQA